MYNDEEQEEVNIQKDFKQKHHKNLFYKFAKVGKVSIKTEEMANKFIQMQSTTETEQVGHSFMNQAIHKKILEYFDQVNTDFYLPQPLFILQFMKKNFLNLT